MGSECVGTVVHVLPYGLSQAIGSYPRGSLGWAEPHRWLDLLGMRSFSKTASDLQDLSLFVADRLQVVSALARIRVKIKINQSGGDPRIYYI